MASLDQTLQVFRALLNSGPDVGVSEADAAIWTYLMPIPGLHAQVEALDKLTREVRALNDPSQLITDLLDVLRRHQERLAERPV